MTLHSLAQLGAIRANLANEGGSLCLYGHIEASSAETRTLAGEAVAYGRVGFTNIGALRVRAGALRWPEDITRVKLTEDHNRSVIRGYVTAVTDDNTRAYVRVKASSDADGDKAIAETIDHKRDGFSIDVVNGVVEEADDGGAPWLTSADVVAIGHVGLPAFYEGSRIDRVAASAAAQKGNSMTEEQRIRLAELRAKQNRTAEEETELSGLAAMEEAAATPTNNNPAPAPAPAPSAPAAPQAVAASLPTVPSGVPRPPSTTTPQGSALDVFVRNVYDLLIARRDGRDVSSITAALSDVTNSGAGANIAMPAWSGELWTGVAYEPEFIPLLNSGSLTNYEGKGWRWVIKPEMADYAGNKAAIPSAAVTTEPSTYTAARQAVGHDIDRKFYDFPDEAFIRSYVEAVRESWFVNLDAKVEAWLIANAVDSTIDVTEGPTALLKAIGRGRRAVKRARLGKASFAIASDEDYDNLLDLADDDLPAFMELFGISPENLVDSANVSAGTVLVGTKMAATVRTFPGSPIRVSAQHLANGGIDEAFFAYWAIEQHAENGVQSVDIVAAP